MLKPDGSTQGSKTVYEGLMSVIDTKPISQAIAFNDVQQYLDTTAFADYMILHWYAGMQDWPHSNWYMTGRNPDGQLRFFAWDGEESWTGDGAEIHFGGGQPSPITDLFQALIQNPEFKIEFADRLFKHTQPTGALGDQAAQTRWQTVNQAIENAIKAEIARWGLIRHERAEPEWWLQEPDGLISQIAAATNRWADQRESDERITYDHWQQARVRVAQEMAGNGDRLIRLARQAGYYPPLDPPQINPNDKPEAGHRNITLTANSDGLIYYTLDGRDPRQAITGKIAPSGKKYTAPFIIAADVQIKARIYQAGQWSALAEWQLQPPLLTEQTNQTPVIISQIMYNPVEGSAYEYITLKNISDQPIDLSGAYFEGIRYQFPLQSYLADGATLTLARDPKAVTTRFPAMKIAGIYQGKLSNDGEQITLKGPGEQILFSVQYDDENGWPLSPDGKGDMLTYSPHLGEPNEPESWQATSPDNE